MRGISPKSQDTKVQRQSAGLILQSINIIQSLTIFILMVIFLSVFLPTFATFINLTNLIKQLQINLIVAAGMTLVIISGEFDLSVGSVLALSGIIAGKLMSELGFLPGVLLGLSVGPIFGLFNGILVTKGKIPSFICTLGSMGIARGLAFVITRGFTVTGFPSGFGFLGKGSIGSIPNAAIIVILIYTSFYVLLKKTRYGRHVYIVGDNKVVAGLMGINTDRVKVIAFVMLGFLASFAGLILTSRLSSIQADTARGFEFDVIAAVIIGGTSLFGGEGNVLLTITGVFIIGFIRNGLNLSHISIFWQEFITGAVIITAVLLDTTRRRMRARVE